MTAIIEHGRTAFQIVTPGRFHVAENHAALTLQKYLFEMTGVMVPVRWGDRLIPREAAIRVGCTAYAPQGLWHRDWFEIWPEGRDLRLFGANARSAHYAVFAFLESLGARFFAPGEERLPKLDRVEMPAATRSTAAFGMRHVFYPTAEEPEWALRWKLNVHDGRDLRWGENAAPHSCSHSFDHLVPVGEYFHTHPEYYSLVDGRRQNEEFGRQLCCTSEAVADVVAERLGRWIAANPDKRIFAVGQNDGAGWCECPACSRVVTREGGQIGPVMTLVNRMAERFPDRIIATLAYADSLNPPREMAVRDNVLVVLCHNAGCHTHSIEGCPENQAFRELVGQWRSRTTHLRIWDYYVNYPSYLMPTFNFRRIERDMRFYQQQGIEAFFCQGSACRGGDFEHLRMYLLAKMLWDPQQDGWAITEEWARGVWGQAAEPIFEYICMFEDHVERNMAHMSTVNCGYTTVPQVFTSELLERGRRLWDAAEAAARREGLWPKVFAARAPEMCSRLFHPLQTYQETRTSLMPVPEPDVELRERFVQAAILHGASALREDQGAPEDFRRNFGRTYEGARLETESLSVLVLPEMGGRVFSLRWREDATPLLKSPDIAGAVNFAPYVGGMDFSIERSWYPPGRGAVEEYRLLDQGPCHVDLAVEAPGGFRIETQYRLDDQRLLSRHRVTNDSDETAAIVPRVNGDWNLSILGDDCMVDMLGADGQWRSMPANPQRRSNRVLRLEGDDLPHGAWRLRRADETLCIDCEFAVASVMYVQLTCSNGRSARMEVQFRDQPLGPGQTATLEIRWRIHRNHASCSTVPPERR